MADLNDVDIVALWLFDTSVSFVRGFLRFYRLFFLFYSTLDIMMDTFKR